MLAERHVEISATGWTVDAARRYTRDVDRAKRKEPTVEDRARFEAVLQRQADDSSHDLGLIVERLAWTPEERLEANASFLRFYWSVRPEGPLIRE
jgi:hypothetical protein